MGVRRDVSVSLKLAEFVRSQIFLSRLMPAHTLHQTQEGSFRSFSNDAFTSLGIISVLSISYYILILQKLVFCIYMFFFY